MPPFATNPFSFGKKLKINQRRARSEIDLNNREGLLFLSLAINDFSRIIATPGDCDRAIVALLALCTHAHAPLCTKDARAYIHAYVYVLVCLRYARLSHSRRHARTHVRAYLDRRTYVCGMCMYAETMIPAPPPYV